MTIGEAITELTSCKNKFLLGLYRIGLSSRSEIDVRRHNFVLMFASFDGLEIDLRN
jgi:hypothetical protein